jgi:cyclopropane-fatty-acyl-phospholipid synthase
MNTDSVVSEVRDPGAGGGLARYARRLVFSHLARIEKGRIAVVEGEARHTFGKMDGLQATVVVRDPAFYPEIAFGGSVGAGEAYMAGSWSADDLTALIRIFLLNRRALADLEGGAALLTRPLHRFLHAVRKNTREGSRRNIAAHYDLGNDFFALWLDPTMTYSCNLFEREDATLEEAAAAKYDRLCRKLRLGPEDRVLEIGGGWGGFAVHAAKNYGCRVTTTTISRQQHDWARERFAREGLTGRIELLFEDYRDLRGKYDKLVSIEMIEAVGHHFLDTYFRVCSDRLEDDGMMALQAITITDQVYESHTRSADFIKRYIFPGSFIPSVSAIVRSVAEVTDMKLYHMEDLAPHYARTLRAWRERFGAHLEEVRRLGYPESFIRMWEYYFCYCEGAFLERYLGDAQMIFAKPDCRPKSSEVCPCARSSMS